MPKPLINVADIVEKNGKTVRENNRAIPHNIPLGTLVEVRYDHWLGDGACLRADARLFVVAHDRDCDETPLYTLAEKPIDRIEAMVEDVAPLEESELVPNPRRRFYAIVRSLGLVWETGFAEESLTPIKVTNGLKRGVGSLTWDKQPAWKLTEIDLSKCHRGEGGSKSEHPDIREGATYLAELQHANKKDKVYYVAGGFSKQWYGWNFNSWGTSGFQLDSSFPLRLWLLESDKVTGV